MNNILVSIIIPVYNAAAYLAECIRSVQQQTLPNIEIIIINDGSTDGSHVIISSLAAADPRIVYINGINEGVSAARNKGIKAARAAYIGFADADDWLEPAMLETLYTNAVKQDADLSVCNVQVWEPDGSKHIRLTLKSKTFDAAANREAALVKLMRFKYDFANWNKIYLANIIRDNKLFFNEDMQVYEDLLFNLCYFQYTKKIVSTELPLYQYRVHAASVMGTATHDAVRENNLLFDGFNRFCTERNTIAGVEACNAELRRGLYYAVLPKLQRLAKQAERNPLERTKLFAAALRKINPGFFQYKEKELAGLQGFKKKLLMKKKFLLFASLSIAKKQKAI